MTKLNLHFLNNSHQVDRPNLITILENFGKEISEYGKEYFSYLVTSSSNEGVLINFSLYIIAPEIGFDYKVISVEILSVKNLKISFFTLVTKQVEHYNVEISNGTRDYEVKLAEILSNSLFNASLQFIVEQIHLKRDTNYEVISSSEIRSHISTNVTVRNNLTLYGIITGEVNIIAPFVFYVYGIVNGRVVVQKGSTLIVNGIIKGDILNSGHCEIYGTVEGELIDKGGSSKILGIIKKNH